MRTTRAVAILGLLAALFSFAPAAAQEIPPAQEDPAAVLYRAALALEAERAYELADELMDYILRRYPDSAAAAEIRARRSTVGARRLDSSGRTELVVWSTLYGLWLGVAIPGAAGADGPEPYGVGLLLGGPLGFMTGFNATRDRPVSDGDAGVITWGGIWGTWQGFGWAQVFADQLTSESVFRSMILGGAVGTTIGLAVANNNDISPGTSTIVNLGSLWGTWYGTALGGILDVQDGDDWLSLTLMGGNLGLAIGAAIARSRPVSRSGVRIASAIGVVGLLAGFGIDLLVQPESTPIAFGIPAVTSTLALTIAARNVGLDVEDAGGREGTDEPGGYEWSLGGPVLPVTLRAEGARRMGLQVPVLSVKF